MSNADKGAGMMTRLWILTMLVLGVSGASAQSTAKKPASPARLELKMEVATANDD